jgi:GNAT superfamily N-acetyltransferase
MQVRNAQAEDAVASRQVMRRSITELCVADHHNNPTVLTRWLSNKTPEHINSWLMQPRNSVLVAVDDENIVAVGSVTDQGRITLNYVSPDARLRGVSRTLIAALEARAVNRGAVRCTLSSTATARGFYLTRGCAEIGPPEVDPLGYPMAKSVLPSHSRKTVSLGSDAKRPLPGHQSTRSATGRA